MAFKIQKQVGWAYGTGRPPYKYEVDFDLTCDLITTKDMVATFSLQGSIVATCNPSDHTIPWRASDYAILNVGTNDPVNYPFTKGTEYFQETLPFVPNAPQSYRDAILAEFRGDIFQGTGVPHAMSLYIKGQGLVLPTVTNPSAEKSLQYTYNINTTFDLPLTGDPSQVVLIWNNSYCNSATDYNWDNHQVWASMFDFDYRPGMTWNGSNWMSHNRSGGVCNVYEGTWTEMRTENGGSGTGNPPLCYGSNGWKNQYKLGQE